MIIVCGSNKSYAYPNIDITYPSIAGQETLLTGGGILTLPTTEPGTSQVIKTITLADLAAFSIVPSSVIQTAIMYVAGLNSSGGTRTLNWKIIKNGSVVQNGSTTVANNNYWTMNFYNLYDVKVGDVIEFKAWVDSTSGVSLNYHSEFIVPTRPIWDDLKGCALVKVGITMANFVLTKGAPANEFSGYMTYSFNGTASYLRLGAMGVTNLGTHSQHATEGLFRTYYGDWVQSYNFSSGSTTAYPKYAQIFTPTKFTFNKTKVRTV